MPDPLHVLPSSFVLPQATLFGPGKIGSLLSECAHFGSRGVVVYGAALTENRRLERLLAGVPDGFDIMPFRHPGGEPTLVQVSLLLKAARLHRASWIAGVGGGSVLDLAKAAAALFNAPHSPEHYHDGEAIAPSGIPFVAVPTTAGTGAEATINSVLTNERTGVKKSIRARGMMAILIILDPDLLATCPPPVIAASGMDAITQAIEAFTSRHATVLSDQLALQGLHLLVTNIEEVYTRLDPAASANLLAGSFMTGVALSFARLGVVHGIAHPLGSIYHVPHGLVCATCLPHALELNRTSMSSKYEVMSHRIGGDLHEMVGKLTLALGIKSPFTGQPLRDRETIIRETLSSGSTEANPRQITRADVEWLLDHLFAERNSA